MNRKIIAYRNVFERSETREFDFIDLIDMPEVIFHAFKIDDFEQELQNIKSIENKEERNHAKRNFIPAVDLSMSGILSIDIDNLSDKPNVKQKCIDKLSALDSCHVLMESVSGNLVAFFKYECTTMEFPFLYYKIYLELTLLLSVSIDFLPEIGRLRYVSNGQIYHKNNESEELTETIDVEELPYIKTSVTKDRARKVVFGSN